MTRAPDIYCGQCGYDLAGLPTGPCPECASTVRAIAQKTSWVSRPLYWVIALLVFVAIGLAAFAFLPGEAGSYGVWVVRSLLSAPVLICATVTALIVAFRTRNRSPFRRVNLDATISAFIAAAMIGAILFSLLFMWMLSQVHFA